MKFFPVIFFVLIFCVFASSSEASPDPFGMRFTSVAPRTSLEDEKERLKIIMENEVRIAKEMGSTQNITNLFDSVVSSISRRMRGQDEFPLSALSEEEGLHYLSQVVRGFRWLDLGDLEANLKLQTEISHQLYAPRMIEGKHYLSIFSYVTTWAPAESDPNLMLEFISSVHGFKFKEFQEKISGGKDSTHLQYALQEFNSVGGGIYSRGVRMLRVAYEMEDLSRPYWSVDQPSSSLHAHLDSLVPELVLKRDYYPITLSDKDSLQWMGRVRGNGISPTFYSKLDFQIREDVVGGSTYRSGSNGELVPSAGSQVIVRYTDNLPRVEQARDLASRYPDRVIWAERALSIFNWAVVGALTGAVAIPGSMTFFSPSWPSAEEFISSAIAGAVVGGLIGPVVACHRILGKLSQANHAKL